MVSRQRLGGQTMSETNGWKIVNERIREEAAEVRFELIGRMVDCWHRKESLLPYVNTADGKRAALVRRYFEIPDSQREPNTLETCHDLNGYMRAAEMMRSMRDFNE
jgi:hypothetical protein